MPKPSPPPRHSRVSDVPVLPNVPLVRSTNGPRTCERATVRPCDRGHSCTQHPSNNATCKCLLSVVLHSDPSPRCNSLIPPLHCSSHFHCTALQQSLHFFRPLLAHCSLAHPHRLKAALLPRCLASSRHMHRAPQPSMLGSLSSTQEHLPLVLPRPRQIMRSGT